MNSDLISPEIRNLIEQKDSFGLKEALQELMLPEIAEIVNNTSLEDSIYVFTNLSSEISPKIFVELLPDIQKNIINALPSEHIAKLLNAIPPDDRTAFLEELPSPVVNQLLKLLNSEERTVTLKLLGYPENSVGRLMTPDYIAITGDMSVQEALDYIRAFGKDSETINVIYVVDDYGHLIDDLRIKELLFASLNSKIRDISDSKFIALEVNADQESAISLFRKNNRAALPVIDNRGILLGIVTFDDILHLINEETTEDIQKIGGVIALDEPYMKTPFFSLMRKRGSWLVLLFIGEMFTATAMGFFQDEIAKAVVLTMFLPLIISSGGNSGSQASTLIICSMALGEISIKDSWRIMKREILSGLFLGTLLGLIGLMRISLWTLFTPIYGEHWLLLGMAVCTSLIGVVLWGTLTGSMLPLLMRRLGFDPASSSAPLVATLVDVTGIIIYFVISMAILKGTLL